MKTRIGLLQFGIVTSGLLVIFQTEAFDKVIEQLSAEPLSVRPSVWLVTTVLAGIAALNVWQAALTIRQHRQKFTIRFSARSLGWLLYVSHAALTISGLLISLSPPDKGPLAGIETVSVVEAIASLVIGFHTAILFSPEDEPVLELKLSYPRPFMWLVVERVGVMLLIHTVIALTGTLVTSVILTDTDYSLLLLRWIAPTIFMVGLALRVTLSTRQIVFGAMAVIFIWFAAAIFGNQIVAQYPFLWPLHVFLEPEQLAHSDYLLNRLMVSALGIGLFISATPTLRNEEFVLTGKG